MLLAKSIVSKTERG